MHIWNSPPLGANSTRKLPRTVSKSMLCISIRDAILMMVFEIANLVEPSV